MKINKRKIGNTNIEVSELGMGTAPIGGWPIEVSENDAFNIFMKYVLHIYMQVLFFSFIRKQDFNII